MAMLIVMNRHQEDTCYDEIELCSIFVKFLLNCIRFIIQHNCEGLCDHLKKMIMSTLTSYNFCTQLQFGNLSQQSL